MDTYSAGYKNVQQYKILKLSWGILEGIFSKTFEPYVACKKILQKQYFTSQHFIHLRTWPFCLMGELGEENFRFFFKKKNIINM